MPKTPYELKCPVCDEDDIDSIIPLDGLDYETLDKMGVSDKMDFFCESCKSGYKIEVERAKEIRPITKCPNTDCIHNEPLNHKESEEYITNSYFPDIIYGACVIDDIKLVPIGQFYPHVPNQGRLLICNEYKEGKN